jgi:hypothetical protein
MELRFEQKGALLKAILLLACGTETQVTLNGRAVRQVPATHDQPAVSLDLTSQVAQGANVLRLTAQAPRVAALLELNGDLAAVRWIVTDAAWTSPDGKVTDLGPVDATGAFNPFDLKKTFDAYNSWQLAKPGVQSQATDPAGFTVPEGFRVQLVRSAQPGEDSWVAMAFDPQGGITLAREKKGLLRFDPKSGRMAEVENSLLECRGLLHAHGVLYANANNTKALFRLRDADGDGLLEQKEELMRTEQLESANQALVRKAHIISLEAAAARSNAAKEKAALLERLVFAEDNMMDWKRQYEELTNRLDQSERLRLLQERISAIEQRAR